MRKRLRKLIIDYKNNLNKDKAINNLKVCISNILEMEDLVKFGLTENNKNDLSDEKIIELANYFYENGINVRCQHFSKLTNEDISKFLESFYADTSGKVTMYDGKTGEKFIGQVTFGYQMIMKLCHLVSNKMHARSIGPYSLVNQQPLGGKARFGGQRCGEMEVWALEAHGAAWNCKEFLTTKSDDPKLRSAVFNCLTKLQRYSLVITGNAINKTIGESFKLLMYELRAAGFDLYLLDENNEKIERIR